MRRMMEPEEQKENGSRSTSCTKSIHQPKKGSIQVQFASLVVRCVLAEIATWASDLAPMEFGGDDRDCHRRSVATE